MQSPGDTEFDALARRLGEALQVRGDQVATAESCTGGWVSMALTSVAGSSRWFERGFVTYSNAAKSELLGVDGEILAGFGAVSRETVLAMATGALANSRAQWSLAISGVAGPDGGTPEKPVGTVWLAWAGPGGVRRAELRVFVGDRKAIRGLAVGRAIEGLLELLDNCI